MKKFFIFLAGFLIGIILFVPKDNLYYTLQSFLQKQNIYINSDIKSGIDLNLKKGTVYYNGMDISKFQKIRVLPFIFYNEIEANKITLNIGNYKINSLKAFYSVFYPLKVFIKGECDFGKIEGYVNLFKKEIKLYIYNLTNSYLKRFLRKDKKGYFYYAKF
jgi:uncharacterized protein (UPF0332 family)